MRTFLHRCPTTGYRVQGTTLSQDDPADRPDDKYQAVTHLACSQVHMVDPETTKVLGAEDEKNRQLALPGCANGVEF